jgi:acetyltransferase-like isoleucine patch superfamily enzyme
MDSPKYRLYRSIYYKWLKHSRHICINKYAGIQNADLENYVYLSYRSSVLNSSIGLRSSIGRNTIIRYSDIGRYCAISWNVTIGADQHPTERISGSGAFFLKQFGIVKENSSKGEVRRCTIGNDVLIGCNAIIISGVSVGNGAIIGAGAVVTHDVGPYEIVAGNPAVLIKKRFDDQTINKLQKIEWWNWDDELLTKLLADFQVPLNQIDINKLLNISKNEER